MELVNGLEGWVIGKDSCGVYAYSVLLKAERVAIAYTVIILYLVL